MRVGSVRGRVRFFSEPPLRAGPWVSGIPIFRYRSPLDTRSFRPSTSTPSPPPIHPTPTALPSASRSTGSAQRPPRPPACILTSPHVASPRVAAHRPPHRLGPASTRARSPPARPGQARHRRPMPVAALSARSLACRHGRDQAGWGSVGWGDGALPSPFGRCGAVRCGWIRWRRGWVVVHGRFFPSAWVSVVR